MAGCHGGIGALSALGKGSLDIGLRGEGDLCAELPLPSWALVSIVKFRGGALLSTAADGASAFGSSVMLRMSRLLTPSVLPLHVERGVGQRNSPAQMGSPVVAGERCRRERLHTLNEDNYT